MGALKQVTTGPPVGKVLEQLEQQATVLLEQDPAHPAADTAKQVVSLLKELRASAAADVACAAAGGAGRGCCRYASCSAGWRWALRRLPQARRLP